MYLIAENEYLHIEKAPEVSRTLLDVIFLEQIRPDHDKECFLANGLGMRLRLTEFSLLKCQTKLLQRGPSLKQNKSSSLYLDFKIFYLGFSPQLRSITWYLCILPCQGRCFNHFICPHCLAHSRNLKIIC